MSCKKKKKKKQVLKGHDDQFSQVNRLNPICLNKLIKKEKKAQINSVQVLFSKRCWGSGGGLKF